MTGAEISKGQYDDDPRFNRIIFAYGFRPFFILSAGYAAFTVLVWAGFWYGLVSLPDNISVVQWHAHEMIFGFVAAALAVFFVNGRARINGRSNLKGARWHQI